MINAWCVISAASLRPAISSSVPRTTRSSGQLALATTAIGVSALYPARAQFVNHLPDHACAEEKHQARMMRRQIAQPLSLRDGRLAGHAGKDDRLRLPGYGVFDT